jgi:hypothetical protein
VLSIASMLPLYCLVGIFIMPYYFAQYCWLRLTGKI